MDIVTTRTIHLYCTAVTVILLLNPVLSCTDEVGVIKDGKTCPQLVTPCTKNECYNTTVETECCASCASFANDTIPDCKYGDEAPSSTCPSIICGFLTNPRDCCESCYDPKSTSITCITTTTSITTSTTTPPPTTTTITPTRTTSITKTTKSTTITTTTKPVTATTTPAITTPDMTITTRKTTAITPTSTTTTTTPAMTSESTITTTATTSESTTTTTTTTTTTATTSESTTTTTPTITKETRTASTTTPMTTMITPSTTPQPTTTTRATTAGTPTAATATVTWKTTPPPTTLTTTESRIALASAMTISDIGMAFIIAGSTTGLIFLLVMLMLGVYIISNKYRRTHNTKKHHSPHKHHHHSYEQWYEGPRAFYPDMYGHQHSNAAKYPHSHHQQRPNKAKRPVYAKSSPIHWPNDSGRHANSPTVHQVNTPERSANSHRTHWPSNPERYKSSQLKHSHRQRYNEAAFYTPYSPYLYGGKRWKTAPELSSHKYGDTSPNIAYGSGVTNSLYFDRPSRRLHHSDPFSANRVDTRSGFPPNSSGRLQATELRWHNLALSENWKFPRPQI